MSTCSVCGSVMLHYRNPDREVCPTPERHSASSSANQAGRKNRGKKNPGAEKRFGKKK